MDPVHNLMVAMGLFPVVVSPFPFLNLPAGSQNNVLRHMKHDQLICFSTLSEKAKNQVKALNLEVVSIHVLIGRYIQIETLFKNQTKLTMSFPTGHYSHYGTDFPKKLVTKIDDPVGAIGKYVCCCVDIFTPLTRWPNNRFNLRGWVDHIQSVLNQPKVDEITFEQEIDQYDVDSLRTIIEGLYVKELCLSFKDLPNYVDMIMSVFPNVVSPFRILTLPSNAQKNIIRNMEPLQQFFISTLSDKTKKLVKSLNIETYRFSVVIANWISIHINFRDGKRIELRFLADENGYLRTRESGIGLGFWTFNSYNINNLVYNIRTSEMDRFGIRDWINHYFEIFNLSEISLSVAEAIGQYNIGIIEDNFKGLHVKTLSLSYGGFYDYTKTIMASLKSINHISIARNPFQDIRKLLFQNYNKITVYEISHRLTLDDLLICNISNLGVYCIESLSDKDLNRFIKHWINGSNSRMEKIHIQFSENRLLDQSVILNGIDFKIVPPEQKRIMKKRKTRLLQSGVVKIYRGGFDIKRNDGTLANIQLQWDEDEETSTFQLVVWHDFNLI